MNYIVMINSFWALRRSCRISPLQADLYFFLLHESNSRNWQNPFYCSNQLVCASLGVTEKSIIEARKALAKMGLIEFENGITKSMAPKYYLLDSCNKVSNPVNNQESKRESNKVSNQVSINGNNIYKQNKTQTKQNQTKQSFGDARSPEEKKDLSNWSLWVESWVKFFKEKNKGVSPNFDSSQGKALKNIKEFLEKNFQEKFPDEDFSAGALDTWRQILNNNHKLDDKWLENQFDLHVVYKKINDIISRLINGSANKNISTSVRLRDQVQEHLKKRFASSESTYS